MNQLDKLRTQERFAAKSQEDAVNRLQNAKGEVAKLHESLDRAQSQWESEKATITSKLVTLERECANLQEEMEVANEHFETVKAAAALEDKKQTARAQGLKVL